MKIKRSDFYIVAALAGGAMLLYASSKAFPKISGAFGAVNDFFGNLFGNTPANENPGLVGGTVGIPIGPDGNPVIGNTMPKDTPSNRLLNQFNLVVGDMTAASGEFSGTPFLAKSLPQMRDEIQQLSDATGYSFPLNTVAYFARNWYGMLDVPFVMGELDTENPAHDPNIETFESRVNDRSIGMMQVRIATARWILTPMFNGAPDDDVINWLHDPVANIGTGMMYLAYQNVRYNRSDLLSFAPLTAWTSAAYNGGSAFFNFVTKKFSNQSYVDRVASAAMNYTGPY